MPRINKHKIASKPLGYLVTMRYAVGQPRNQEVDIEERLVFVMADSALGAYQLSVKRGADCVEVESRVFGEDKDAIEFLGIPEVVPVWENMEHLNELGYREYPKCSVSLVRDDLLCESDF